MIDNIDQTEEDFLQEKGAIKDKINRLNVEIRKEEALQRNVQKRLKKKFEEAKQRSLEQTDDEMVVESIVDEFEDPRISTD